MCDIHRQHVDRFDDYEKCVVVKMPDSIGRYVDTYAYTFKGFLEVCRYSNQLNANAVMDGAWDTLDRLRRGEVLTSPFQKIESLKTRLLLAEQKLQLFEEYNEDILYDFDPVAFGSKKESLWIGHSDNAMVKHDFVLEDDDFAESAGVGLENEIFHAESHAKPTVTDSKMA